MDLGFVPVHYYSDELGFGLWSYAAPGGRCLTYKESRQAAGGIFDGDNIYSNVLMNNDTNWSIARIIAIVGIIFGAIALVSALINVCKGGDPHLVDILTWAIITAFMTECSKLGIFLGTDLCSSNEYWYNTELNEFSGAKDCQIDRGAFMSITSMGTYFISMVMAIGFAARPKKDDFTYEEASLPSWMASENGESAIAHAPPPKPVHPDDRLSSVGGYDWSRSAPSTIPSQENTIEDYGLAREPIPEHDDGQKPIRSYPPTNGAPRRYDDMSTLTFDPGY